ncbi:hypothetical protein QR680_012231 [Steinernema hermaphroditum]|uniref:Tyrosine specific protein phosphatases domain-containing protein n=1 Tax=Steinernema hermaphroditum TaxID=289476 RepID=A0AA39M068_9BILA|nr:hypothetical protein QR680_012231 [Steinernema hermaphroditum]
MEITTVNIHTITIIAEENTHTEANNNIATVALTVGTMGEIISSTDGIVPSVTRCSMYRILANLTILALLLSGQLLSMNSFQCTTVHVKRDITEKDRNMLVLIVPVTWKNYIAVGAEVSGTPFIPFKTPLRPEFNGRLRKTEIFNVETLMHCARNSDKRIGFVIDLTNTTRYYDANLWKNYGIRYHKIPNSGRDVHTQGEFFDRFKKAVDEFRKENEESGDDLLIGVHCTHGLNRTGYLICRYMIEVLNIDAKGAISEFEKSRGHAIRRSEYINALKEIAQMKPDFNEEEWAEGMSEKSRKAAVETSRKRSWLDALHEEEAKDPAPTEVTPENSNPQE